MGSRKSAAVLVLTAVDSHTGLRCTYDITAGAANGART